MKISRPAKLLAERALCRVIGRPQRMRGRGLILAYHNVTPDDAPSVGDRSLHLKLSTLQRQLDLIEEHCHVAPVGAILGGAVHPSKPTVAITFDDAYRGAVELGIPAIAARGLASTLFVAPGLFGAHSFWWDELAASRDGLSAAARAHVLNEHAGRQDSVALNTVLSRPNAVLPGSYSCASENEVLALRKLPSVTFGAHSWSHPNLTCISNDDLATELSRPLQWLSEQGLPTVSVLAYPYGLRSPRVAESAKRAGYSAALLVEGGWVDHQTRDPWGTPRYNVPAGLSDEGFLLRLSGLFCD